MPVKYRWFPEVISAFMETKLCLVLWTSLVGDKARRLNCVMLYSGNHNDLSLDFEKCFPCCYGKKTIWKTKSCGSSTILSFIARITKHVCMKLNIVRYKKVWNFFGWWYGFSDELVTTFEQVICVAWRWSGGCGYQCAKKEL